ncbi:response regulator transcription factor [Superficieibacter electus]|uniref:response regulator transcription factor n=1 Tax=Superficieibacter electus TaxID=2022662 RepID=UPI001C4088FE|nr:helix-turn-helix transcriptional regulator [Superficieibacter electus]
MDWELPDIQALASVVGHIGKPTLPGALDDLLAGSVAFDLSVIFGFPFDAKPIILHDNQYRHSVTAVALENYLQGTYLFDPFYTACAENHASGLWRMSELAPDAFYDSAFYSASDVHPCISMQVGSIVEEIGFLVPLEGEVNAIYSLMRLHGDKFSPQEMAALTRLEPFVRETIRTHWRDVRIINRQMRFDDLMETAFASFCQEVLTWQQRRIVQLILRGHSNYAIGQILSVTEGTIKLHRQNIYRRLNISSQRELFALFVEQLFPVRQSEETAKR